MVLVKINKFEPLENIKHISTTWVISKDKEFKEIIKEYKKSNMLDLLYADIDIPVGITYYVKATRHFTNPLIDYDLEIIPVTSKEEKYNNLILPEDTIIEYPYTFIEGYEGKEKDAILNLNNVTIKTSKFKSNNDIHKATHYFILNQDKKILFYKLNAEGSEKQKINIDVTSEMKNSRILKFITIHKGATGLESRAGELCISMVEPNINFTISTDLENVEPLKDLEVILKPIDNRIDIGIKSVYLLKTNSYETITGLPIYNNKLIIPWHYLNSDNKLTLQIEVIGSDRINTEYIYRDITINNNDNYIDIDLGFKYNYTFSEFTSDDIRLPDNIASKSLYNGCVLFPDYETNVMKSYLVTNNSITYRKEIPDIKIPRDKNNMLIFPLTKTLFIVDTLNENNKPTFYVYSYNIINDNFRLIHSFTRESETICLGKTINVMQISSSEIIYIPVGTNKLRLYNLLTNEIKDLKNIPLEGLTKGILLRSYNNTIFIANGINSDACCYDYITNEYTLGYNYNLPEHINKNTKCMMLRNVCSLIQDVDNINNPFVLFNIANMSFIQLPFKFDVTMPTSIIYTNQHNVIYTNYRTSYEFGNNQRFFVFN